MINDLHQSVPKLVAGVDLTVLDDGIVSAGLVSVFLVGIELYQVTPLIDGVKTIAEINLLLDSKLTQSQITDALRKLTELGLIAWESTDPRLVSPGWPSASLSSLLSPLCVADFVRSYAIGRTLHVAGTPSKFQSLFDMNMFDRACEGGLSLRATYAASDRASMSPSQEIDARCVGKHYEQGATVCVTGVDRFHSHLAALVASCKRELGYTGHIDCRSYLSGDRAGYTPHFDARTVITLQIEGEKTWHVSDTAAVRYPYDNAGCFGDGIYRYYRSRTAIDEWESFVQPTLSDATSRFTLRQGDLLVVPAGAWHAAEASGHSLSLTLTLNYVDGGSTQDIVLSILRRLLMAESDWRSPPPMTVPSSHNVVSYNEEIDQFFIAKLQQVSNIINTLTGDRSQVSKQWQACVDRHGK